MKLWYSPYQLKLKHLPNSRTSEQVRRGALIKIEHPNLGFGYSDLHPSLELGDLSVEQQLSLFREDRLTVQMQQAVFHSQLDARARSQKESLFTGLKIPKSHFLILSIENFTREKFENALDSGFERFKFKFGRDLKTELDALRKISEFELGDARFRFDFNCSLTQGIFYEFWRALPRNIQGRIEFIEDPFEYSELDWLRAEQFVPLALDRDLAVRLGEQKGFSVAVIKPARENVDLILPKIKKLGLKYLFTTSLDHPVGQMFAALNAALCANDVNRLDSGLLSLSSFEKNNYFEKMSSRGPWLEGMTAPGIGFGDLLEKENWIPIYEN